jgi:glycosyltransferase involved in cell wall biosynthesis
MTQTQHVAAPVFPATEPRAAAPEVSVVVPMKDEAANVASTLAAIVAELERSGRSFEILPVDDGSTDGTRDTLDRLAARDPRIRPLHHSRNRGRGAALRTGFARACGRWVVSIDADLSYTADHVPMLVDHLAGDTEVDMVVGSPYMKGGRTEGVPWARWFASRLGNRLLEQASGRWLHTFTGILRGYRRESLGDLELTMDGKEIHLEILSQAVALGWKIVEVPAVLRCRRAGASKFRWRRTTATHLLHIASERPFLLFGLAGGLLLLAGLVVLFALLGVWRQGALNPERPLMTVLLVLMLGGFQLLAFGFLGTQIADLRRTMIRFQRTLRRRRNRGRDSR